MKDYKPAWRCWASLQNIPKEDGKIVYAETASKAAELYAEVLYSFFEERFSSIEVTAVEANNHYAKPTSYRVDVEVKPQFYSSRIYENS